MSSNPSISSGVSQHRASSSHNDVAQEPESSNASQPPPYTKNAPLDDPFRDGDAPVGYFYPNNNGMQKGLKPATAPQLDTSPATTATLVDSLTPAGDRFPVDIVIDESFLPPLPPRPPGLRRGLQIPSRVSLITWGFSFPDILAEQGITKPQWRRFKHELEEFARMTLSQKLTIALCNILITHVFGVGIVIGTVASWKMQKHREHENFLLAYQRGLFKTFEDRWNNDYFHPLGLHVRIEPPGIGKMDGMDVASSKLFRYQQKMGTSSPAPGVASGQEDKKECRYQRKEGRYRMKAAQKGRIIVLPLDMVNALPSQLGKTSQEGHKGQSRGVTAKAGASNTDFACSYKSESVHRV